MSGRSAHLAKSQQNQSNRNRANKTTKPRTETPNSDTIQTPQQNKSPTTAVKNKSSTTTIASSPFKMDSAKQGKIYALTSLCTNTSLSLLNN